MNFIIAQISNWTTSKRHNYNFTCLESNIAASTHYRCLDDMSTFVSFQDSHWRKIRKE